MKRISVIVMIIALLACIAMLSGCSGTGKGATADEKDIASVAEQKPTVNFADLEGDWEGELDGEKVTGTFDKEGNGSVNVGGVTYSVKGEPDNTVTVTDQDGKPVDFSAEKSGDDLCVTVNGKTVFCKPPVPATTAVPPHELLIGSWSGIENDEPITYIFAAGGEGSAVVSGIPFPITYSATDTEVTVNMTLFTESETGTCSYTIKGNTLTLTKSTGETNTYTRS